VDQVEEEAVAWALRCDPPMEVDEVRKIVRDLAAREARRQVEQGNAGQEEEWEPPVSFDDHDLPPFPSEIFPDWLRAFVEAEAIATQTPVDLPGMLCLASLATACSKKVEVRVNEGYFEPVNLYVAVAMPPASRKSAVFRDIS